MAYSRVQTFFINSDSVGGADQVLITGIELYVKAKPKRTKNKSGLENPSIAVQIVPATRDGPKVVNIVAAKRSKLSWDQITASANATVKSVFNFNPPISVSTDNYFGALIEISDDDYTLWESVQGHKLVGTNTPSSGPNGRYDGYLYEGVRDTVYRAISGKDLKFGVKVARFSANTTANVNFVPENYEYLGINKKIGDFLDDEPVFIDASNRDLTVPVFDHKPGTLTFKAGNLKDTVQVIGVGTTFTTTLQANKPVILTDANNQNNYTIGVVNNVVNNTLLYLKSGPGFAANATGRYQVSATADVYEATPYNDETNEIVLYQSNANSSVRFVGGGLRGANVSNTGAGYSNTNIVRVVNNQGGGDATFNIVTSNTGSISSLTVNSPGYNFSSNVLPSNVRIETSISNTTLKAGNPGANAVITVDAGNVGLKLRGPMSKAQANIVSVDNKYISEMWPIFQEVKSADGTIAASHAFSNGLTVGLGNTPYSNTKLSILNELVNEKAVLASKSNEAFANTGVSSRFRVKFSVNKTGSFLFDTPIIESERSTVIVYENDINNDATNEHTNSGNAISKYIGKRIKFETDALSEDLMVHVRTSRPVGTDVKVYAKLHNSVDDEAFDDKLWTELEKITPDVFTNPKDKTQQTEIKYSIPQYPAVSENLPGVVTTANNSANVAGVGTTFSNTLIGKLIRIYSPLNVKNHQIASVVSVTNTTHLVLGSPVVNNSVQESVVGTGLKIQSLGLVGTAFNNILNDNVSRYYTLTNQAEIDGFDTFAIKVVLLSNNKYIVPVVNDIRMMGVSA